MRELYRRYGALALLFTAVTFFLAIREEVVRLRAVDMAEEYRSAFSPVEAFGATGAARRLTRSWKQFSTIPAFIDSHTEGRLTTAEGKEWEEVFAGVLAPAEASPLQARRSTDKKQASYYFLPDESPIEGPIHEMKNADQTFRFLKLSGPSGPRFIGMTLQGPKDAIYFGAPLRMLRPFRSIAAIPLILALLLYFVFPPRKKAPAGALVYPKWTSWILPDMMGFAVSCLFYALPFFVALELSGGGNPLDPGSGLFITLPLWLLAAIFASMLYWSARYSSFFLLLLPDGFTISVLGKEQRIRYAAVEYADFADFRPRKWFRKLLFIAALLNPRMAGQALLVTGRRDWGAELRLKEAAPVRILCSHLPCPDKIISALQRGGVKISPELEKAFEALKNG